MAIQHVPHLLCAPARLASGFSWRGVVRTFHTESVRSVWLLRLLMTTQNIQHCQSEAWSPHLAESSMSTEGSGAAASSSTNIMHPVVQTTLKRSGYLMPTDYVRMSATCRGLAGFCSREAATAQQLLQHAASPLQARKHPQQQQPTHQDPATSEQHGLLVECSQCQVHYDCVVQAAAQLGLTGVTS